MFACQLFSQTNLRFSSFLDVEASNRLASSSDQRRLLIKHCGYGVHWRIKTYCELTKDYQNQIHNQTGPSLPLHSMHLESVPHSPAVWPFSSHRLHTVFIGQTYKPHYFRPSQDGYIQGRLEALLQKSLLSKQIDYLFAAKAVQISVLKVILFALYSDFEQVPQYCGVAIGSPPSVYD